MPDAGVAGCLTRLSTARSLVALGSPSCKHPRAAEVSIYAPMSTASSVTSVIEKAIKDTLYGRVVVLTLVLITSFVHSTALQRQINIDTGVLSTIGFFIRTSPLPVDIPNDYIDI